MSQNDPLRLYVGGQWVERQPASPVINPATVETIGSVSRATQDDLDSALAAAGASFKSWRQTNPWQRQELLERIAVLIERRAESIAKTITLEQGKPLAESRNEVQRAVEAFRWAAEEGKRIYGQVIPSRDPDMRQLVLREPIGPVAAFTPWNFPLFIAARKVACALAAGCTCILKPAEETPGAAVAMAECCVEAGLPNGVLNLVFGVPADISSYLIPSDVIGKVTFTGSIPVGKQLYALAAQSMKPCTFELGGHAAALVMDDVDVEQTAAKIAAFKYRNAGQVCLTTSRVYVHQSIFDRFVDQFTRIAEKIVVGDGMEATTQMGPLANRRRIDAVEKFVNDAVERGATLATGGSRIGNQGFFYRPTVLTDVPEAADMMNVEPFGPVMPINRFSDVGSAVEAANRLKYGLSAYVFTRSLGLATEISNSLEAGVVGVNNLTPALAEAPFGGHKESGIGVEGGIDGMVAFTKLKFVSQLAQ